MKNKHLRNIVISAVFAAIILVATGYLPRFPILGGAGGYVHVGDTFIYLAASILPLPYAMLAGAVGGSLADALSGYMLWAPATFIIKALMALPFSSKGAKFITARNAAASIGAGLICTAGYYIYEAIFISSFTVALASAPFNLIQGLISTVLYLIAGFAFDRLNLKSRLET
jgi:uncharacterized repeat protein (TIGR04002 family)